MKTKEIQELIDFNIQLITIGCLGKNQSLRMSELINQALASLQAEPKTFDFAIAHNYLNDDCCGVLYWSADGKILCNECGKEFDLREQAEPDIEFNSRGCSHIDKTAPSLAYVFKAEPGEEFTKDLRRIIVEYKRTHTLSHIPFTIGLLNRASKACGLIDRQQTELENALEDVKRLSADHITLKAELAVKDKDIEELGAAIKQSRIDYAELATICTKCGEQP